MTDQRKATPKILTYASKIAQTLDITDELEYLIEDCGCLYSDISEFISEYQEERRWLKQRGGRSE